MYIGAIIEALRAHELNNSYFGDQLDKIVPYGTSNKLPVDDREAIKTHINDALRALYARFSLKEQHLYLGCKGGVGVYHLTEDQVEGGVLGKYILDETYATEVGAFTEDVLIITGIRDASTDIEIPFNEGGNPLAITSINSITIRVPNYLTSEEKVLKISYRALPKEWVGLRDADL